MAPSFTSRSTDTDGAYTVWHGSMTVQEPSFNCDPKDDGPLERTPMSPPHATQRRPRQRLHSA